MDFGRPIQIVGRLIGYATKSTNFLFFPVEPLRTLMKYPNYDK